MKIFVQKKKWKIIAHLKSHSSFFKPLFRCPLYPCLWDCFLAAAKFLTATFSATISLSEDIGAFCGIGPYSGAGPACTLELVVPVHVSYFLNPELYFQSH